MNSFALISSLFLLFNVSPSQSSPLDLITTSRSDKGEGSNGNEGSFLGFLRPGQEIVSFLNSIPFLSGARDFIRSGAETTLEEIGNLRSSVSSTAAANPISTIFENTFQSLHSGAQNLGQFMSSIVQDEEVPSLFRGKRIAPQIRNATQKDEGLRQDTELTEAYKRFLQESQDDSAVIREKSIKMTKILSEQISPEDRAYNSEEDIPLSQADEKIEKRFVYLSSESEDQEELSSEEINKLTSNNRSLKKDLTKLKNLKYKYPSRIPAYINLKSKKSLKMPSGLKKRKYVSAATPGVRESTSKETLSWSDSSKGAFAPASFSSSQSIPKPFIPPEMKSGHYFEDGNNRKFDFYQNVFAN